MEYFSTGAVIKQAWGKFKAHFGYLWLMLAIVIVITALFEWVYQAGERSDTSAIGVLLFFFSLASLFVNLLMHLGLVRVSLDVVDSDTRHPWTILFSQTDKVLRFLGASILYALMVLAGLILFVVPGLYLALRFQFYGYLILDKNAGIMESLKGSAAITRGVMWRLVGFALAMAGIVVLGFLAVLVGLVVAIPITMLAAALVYRSLSRRLEEPAGEASETTAPLTPAPTPAPSPQPAPRPPAESVIIPPVPAESAATLPGDHK